MAAQKPEQVKGIAKKYYPMIQDCEADEDGYWIYLNKGWTNGDCHTIHEDSKTQAIKCLPGVLKCECKICSDPDATL
jgi:Zn-finger protein